jgi:exonuclease SbcD
MVSLLVERLSNRFDLFSMKLLHTSDWHLGRMLYGRKRYEEFALFLDWLLSVIDQEQIDCLIVAGDIFDTTTPSNAAQELYYRFLTRVTSTQCKHVIVLGGNHDSASFLNAPKGLLKSLNVHVVGACSSEQIDDVLVLNGIDGKPQMIVGAVPYLRDRDIRTVEAGEDFSDKTAKLTEGIRRHYQQIGELTLMRREELGQNLPIVLTGHLFASGGSTVDGDGVRELYVGSLARITSDLFPSCLNYLALGHLHVPQVIGGNEYMRYSGSPIAMGFGEANQIKSICVITFEGTKAAVSLKDVPRFQELKQVKGDWLTVQSELFKLVSTGRSIWVEVVYSGKDFVDNLRGRVDQIVDGSSVEVIRIKNNQIFNAVLAAVEATETLEDLTPKDVFARCMQAHNVDESRFADLAALFDETLQSLQEDDAGEF